MLGKILQTVGERMAFYDDSYTEYHTALVSPVLVCANANHLSPTKALVTTTVGRQGMRPCI